MAYVRALLREKTILPAICTKGLTFIRVQTDVSPLVEEELATFGRTKSPTWPNESPYPWPKELPAWAKKLQTWAKETFPSLKDDDDSGAFFACAFQSISFFRLKSSNWIKQGTKVTIPIDESAFIFHTPYFQNGEIFKDFFRANKRRAPELEKVREMVDSNDAWHYWPSLRRPNPTDTLNLYWPREFNLHNNKRFTFYVFVERCLKISQAHDVSKAVDKAIENALVTEPEKGKFIYEVEYHEFYDKLHEALKIHPKLKTESTMVGYKQCLLVREIQIPYSLDLLFPLDIFKKPEKPPAVVHIYKKKLTEEEEKYKEEKEAKMKRDRMKQL